MQRLARIWLMGVTAVFWAAAAGAGERFYPVIGPDGKIQQVRSESEDDADADPVSAKKKATAAPSRGAAPAAAAPGSAGVAAAPGDGRAAAEPEAGKPSVPHAPYDSEQYVDSEAVDAAAASPASQQRFYMIDEGSGPRISEMEAGEGAGVDAPVVTAPMQQEPYESLPAAFTEVEAAAAAREFPELPACVAAADLEQAPVLVAGTPGTLLVNRAAYMFLAPSRVLATYRVEGDGPRTIVARSYSRKDRPPAFVHPRLAFLGKDGCLKRVLHGYFERRYQRTDRRHAMLRGDLLMHAQEAWLLVLAPREDDKTTGELPFLESGHGQLKFTLKK